MMKLAFYCANVKSVADLFNAIFVFPPTARDPKISANEKRITVSYLA